MLYPRNPDDLKKIYKKMPSRYTVIQWSASWCAPCRMIKPKVEQLSNQLDVKDVKFIYLDTEQFADYSENMDIRSLPTFSLFDSKQNVIGQVVGADLRGVLDMINSKTDIRVDPKLSQLV